MKPRIGVFQIKNTANSKIYVDSSTNLATVWNGQKFRLNNEPHPNTVLQQDWKECGELFFVFEVLSEVAQHDGGEATDYHQEARQLRAMFIDELQPFGEKGITNQHTNVAMEGVMPRCGSCYAGRRLLCTQPLKPNSYPLYADSDSSKRHIVWHRQKHIFAI